MKNLAYQVVEKLWTLNRIFSSTDYDKSLAYLASLLPFKIHEFTDSALKGWVIPPKWDLEKGVISFEGKAIYNVDHPLKIMGLSLPFKGKVSLKELKEHLYFDHRDSTRIPYHFRQHYRPWDRTWGFCVSKDFYTSLKEGEYFVEIETKESNAPLKVAEYVKKGRCKEGFAFVAHLDHPGMANDDLAGVAAGVELFKRLSTLETKFTYRLILVQEMIGSVFYLDKLKKAEIIESCFLEMLGTNTPLAFQSSRQAKSFLEQQIEEALITKKHEFKKGPFRSVICNDESVWESYQIPMCSLSRYPYPEYHSDHDNLSIISEKALTDAVDVVFEAIEKLESKTLIEKKFEGVYALSHPSFNLYVDPGQPAFGDLPNHETQKLRSVMDEIPLLPKYTFLENFAKQQNISPDVLRNYLKLWEEKDLLKLI